jgi:hypothetical protein
VAVARLVEGQALPQPPSLRILSKAQGLLASRPFWR